MNEHKKNGAREQQILHNLRDYNLIINAKDSKEFIFVLAFRAFTTYLRLGRSIIVVSEKELKPKKDGSFKVTTASLSLAEDIAQMDEETQNYVKSYNPCKEIVMDVCKEDGKAQLQMFTPKDRNSYPQEAYRTGLKESGVIPIVPGSVVNMRSGYGFDPQVSYVFIDQHKKDGMLLMPILLKNSKKVLTNEILMHIDFQEALEETDENMWDEVLKWRKNK